MARMTEQEVCRFTLDAQGIDEVANKIFTILQDEKYDRKTCFRLRLSIDSILLEWLENGMADARCRLVMEKRFGRKLLVLEARPQTGLFPVGLEDLQSDTFFSTLSSGLGVEWSVSVDAAGARALLDIPPKKAGAGLINLGALALGVALGLILRLALPEVGEEVLVLFANPLFETYLGMLSAVIGPMLFFTVLVAVIGLDNLAALKNTGKTTFVRQLLYGLGATLAATATMVVLYGVSLDGGGSVGGGLVDIERVVLGIIPNNLVDPFLTGNALQIIVWALAVGVGIVVLRRKVPGLAVIVREAETVVQWIMSTVLKLLPLFVLVAMVRLTMSADVEVMLNLLVLMACLAALTLAISAVGVVSTALTAKVSPAFLVKTALPAGIIGLTTASSSAAYTTNDEVMRKKFAMDDNFSHFAHSFALGFFQPSDCISLVLLLFYTASTQGEQLNLMALPVVIITCTLLGSSSPPIPGGQIPIYAIAVSSVGLGAEAVAVFAAIDFVIDAIATGGKCFLIPIHSLKTACMLDKCDLDRLHENAGKANGRR